MNRRRWHPLWLLPLGLIAVVVVSDLLGWSYLRRPVQSLLSSVLDREVSIGPPFRVHLRPRIPVEIGSITIAAPTWSDAPHFLSAEGIAARVGWGVLVGRQPRLHLLSVQAMDVQARRDGEGRATWRFGEDEPEQPDEEGAALPRIERLEIGRARFALDDATSGLRMDIVASTREGTSGEARDGAPRGATDTGGDADLVARGEGSWNDTPLSFELVTPRLLEAAAGGKLEGIELTARLGKTEASFHGSLDGLPAFGEVYGDLAVSGPSLAELALVRDLVLPDTPSYELEAKVRRAGQTVKVDVSKAEIGSSSMTARLEYDAGATPPTLRGTIDASRFVLQDLGPALGSAPERANGEGRSSGVLPDREFQVPKLRAMNAEVRLDLRRMDLGTDALRPLSAVRGRLLLEEGRLRLDELNASLAEGSLAGTATLDASRDDADPRFEARLHWKDVDLRKWVRVGDDFLVAGRFSGETELAGNGQSTARILGSLDGPMKGRIDGGALSHQLIELAGLDVGQALGVFVSGDEPLELTCGLIDLSAKNGTVRSNLFLLDTRDTLFFLQGQVDLGKERLDLRLVQSPKDWSPLSLRAPLLVRGTFDDPDIGVEAAPVALKLLASVVAGAVAPIAALIPLFEGKDNEQPREGCGPAVEQVRKKAAELREKGKGEPGGDAQPDGKAANAAPGAGEQGKPPRGAAAGRPGPAEEGMPQASPGGKDPLLDPSGATAPTR